MSNRYRIRCTLCDGSLFVGANGIVRCDVCNAAHHVLAERDAVMELLRKDTERNTYGESK